MSMRTKSSPNASSNSGALNTVGLMGGPSFGPKYSGNIKAEGKMTPVHAPTKQDGGKVKSNVNDMSKPTTHALKPGSSPK